MTKDELRDKFLKEMPMLIAKGNNCTYAEWLESLIINTNVVNKNDLLQRVMPSTLPEPQQWFMEKFDVTASRMNLIEHKGNDVVRFIHEYLDDLP